MNNRVAALALASLGAAMCGVRPGSSQPPPEWRDPSPHQGQFVTVAPDVRLEVLDWGGSGRAVVLLAGAGNTAHIFDDFAQKLSASCHVYGITRRGSGASSQPASGYDDQRLADDVLSVLDVLKLRAPVLAGHSMAGGELTTLGNQHSDRLSGLVYLDALGDPRDWPASDPAYRALLEQLPEAMRQSPPLDRSSFEAYRASQLRGGREKFAFPESELRQIFLANPDGSLGGYTTPGRVHEAIGAGQKKRDYSDIKLPVLALLEMPRATHDASVLPNQYQPRNEQERAAIQAFVDATSAYVDRWIRNLKTGVPTARIVDLPGAGHFVFLTREAEVLREMRTFVARLQ